MNKTIVLILLTITSFFANCQTTTLQPLRYTSDSVTYSFQNPAKIYKNYFVQSSFNDLQVYSPTIGFLENYTFISEGNYQREDEMSLLYRNKYVLTLNSTSILLPLNNRIDSFNPYGVNSLPQALGFGLLNLLWHKN